MGLAITFADGLWTVQSQSTAGEATTAGAAEEQSFSWSLVTTWPKNYPGLGMAPERFSKLVEEMTRGQLKVNGLRGRGIGASDGSV